MKKTISYIFFILGGLAGLYGTYSFLYHFFTDFGVHRIIMAPIILPLYNLPAIILIFVGSKLNK
jgi:hypothetical protein